MKKNMKFILGFTLLLVCGCVNGVCKPIQGYVNISNRGHKVIFTDGTEYPAPWLD